MDQFRSQVSKTPCQTLRKMLKILTGQTLFIMPKLGSFVSNTYLPLRGNPKSQSHHHCPQAPPKHGMDVDAGPSYQADC